MAERLESSTGIRTSSSRARYAPRSRFLMDDDLALFERTSATVEPQSSAESSHPPASVDLKRAVRAMWQS